MMWYDRLAWGCTISLIQLLSAWVVHEGGHYYMAWRYGANPQVEFGSRSFVVSWTKKLTHKEYVNVVAAGVVMGLIPFIAFMPAHAASLGFEVWVALAMYVWSARKDIRVLAGGGV